MDSNSLPPPSPRVPEPTSPVLCDVHFGPAPPKSPTAATAMGSLGETHTDTDDRSVWDDVWGEVHHHPQSSNTQHTPAGEYNSLRLDRRSTGSHLETGCRVRLPRILDSHLIDMLPVDDKGLSGIFDSVTISRTATLGDEAQTASDCLDGRRKASSMSQPLVHLMVRYGRKEGTGRPMKHQEEGNTAKDPARYMSRSIGTQGQKSLYDSFDPTGGATELPSMSMLGARMNQLTDLDETEALLLMQPIMENGAERHAHTHTPLPDLRRPVHAPFSPPGAGLRSPQRHHHAAKLEPKQFVGLQMASSVTNPMAYSMSIPPPIMMCSSDEGAGGFLANGGIVVSSSESLMVEQSLRFDPNASRSVPLTQAQPQPQPQSQPQAQPQAQPQPQAHPQPQPQPQSQPQSQPQPQPQAQSQAQSQAQPRPTRTDDEAESPRPLVSGTGSICLPPVAKARVLFSHSVHGTPTMVTAHVPPTYTHTRPQAESTTRNIEETQHQLPFSTPSVTTTLMPIPVGARPRVCERYSQAHHEIRQQYRRTVRLGQQRQAQIDAAAHNSHPLVNRSVTALCGVVPSGTGTVGSNSLSRLSQSFLAADTTSSRPYPPSPFIEAVDLRHRDHLQRIVQLQQSVIDQVAQTHISIRFQHEECRMRDILERDAWHALSSIEMHAQTFHRTVLSWLKTQNQLRHLPADSGTLLASSQRVALQRLLIQQHRVVLNSMLSDLKTPMCV